MENMIWLIEIENDKSFLKAIACGRSKTVKVILGVLWHSRKLLGLKMTEEERQ